MSSNNIRQLTLDEICAILDQMGLTEEPGKLMLFKMQIKSVVSMVFDGTMIASAAVGAFCPVAAPVTMGLGALSVLWEMSSKLLPDIEFTGFDVPLPQLQPVALPIPSNGFSLEKFVNELEDAFTSGGINGVIKNIVKKVEDNLDRMEITVTELINKDRIEAIVCKFKETIRQCNTTFDNFLQLGYMGKFFEIMKLLKYVAGLLFSTLKAAFLELGDDVARAAFMSAISWVLSIITVVILLCKLYFEIKEFYLTMQEHKETYKSLTTRIKAVAEALHEYNADRSSANTAKVRTTRRHLDTAIELAESKQFSCRSLDIVLEQLNLLV